MSRGSLESPHTARLRGEPPLELTPREQQILQALAGGASNREIADAVLVSENTVKYHLRNVYYKLGVASRLQAVLSVTADSRGESAGGSGPCVTWRTTH